MEHLDINSCLKRLPGDGACLGAGVAVEAVGGHSERLRGQLVEGHVGRDVGRVNVLQRLNGGLLQVAEYHGTTEVSLDTDLPRRDVRVALRRQGKD